MSFNTFGKAGKFLELNFGPGIFWGFSWEAQGYYCVLVFALIRSSLSLEILSSPPPPPLSGHAVGQKRKHFLPLGAEIFVRTQCTSCANVFFLSFCPQAWLPCQPVHHFFPSLFSQGN